MSGDRIHRLHEQASERYLHGDYRAALATWRELLELDPANEHALEGVRMAKNLGGEELAIEADGGTVAAVANFSLEDEIDDGLLVLGGAPKPPASAPTPAPIEAGRHPDRQGEGIDFGDSEGVTSIPLALDGAGAASMDASAPEPLEPSWSPEADAPPVLAFDDSETSGGSAEAASVAEEALRHRVLDLLGEARECRDQGEIEAALGVISRIYILDESNAAARALEAELRAPGDTEVRAVEDWLAEGIQAFDLGRLDEAADLFHRVLERSPGHGEATQYLDAIATRDVARGASPGELLEDADLLGDIPLGERSSAAREPAPVERAGAAWPAAPATQPTSAEFPVEPTAAARPRRPIPKWAIAATIGIVALLGVLLVVKWWSGGPASESADESATPQPGPSPRTKGANAPANPEPAPPAPGNDTSSLEAALQRARAAKATGDYGAAVVAYNEALAVSPTDPEALAGLREAAESYRAWKAEQEQLDGIREAFRSGEFTASLRAIYRLPESYDQNVIDRWKVTGWFNLGVVALRAGDAATALTNFDEALAIRPDPEVSKWRSFAQQYRNRPKDRVFYATAEALPFRTLD